MRHAHVEQDEVRGSSCPTRGSTCVPDCVSPTISKPPSASSARLIPSRTSRWSSAITTRTTISVAQGPDAASAAHPTARLARAPRRGSQFAPGLRSRPSSEGLPLPKTGDTLRADQQNHDPVALEARGESTRVRSSSKQRRETTGDGDRWVPLRRLGRGRGDDHSSDASRALREHGGRREQRWSRYLLPGASNQGKDMCRPRGGGTGLVRARRRSVTSTGRSPTESSA